MKSVKVSDYMARRLVTFSPETNVVEAMAMMLKHKISGAPVVDGLGALVGVLSEVDVMEIVVQDSYYDESMGIVADYMQTKIDVVSPEDDIYYVSRRFHHEHRRRFPVVKNGRLVGQISRRDVLRAAQDFLTDKKGR